MLDSNKKYDIALTLSDKTKNSVVNTTEEIMEENVDHRFYFIPSSTAGITVTDLNKDDNGLTLGLTSKWSTGVATTGTMQIVL